MDYKGHIEDGKVILEGNAHLPEGAEVRVELTKPKRRAPSRAPRR